MRSFIIHMAGDTRRAPNAQSLATRLPDATIAEAVVGREALARGTVRVAPGTLHRPHYPFALSPGEVGCFLSHRACWQRIVDEGLDWAIIAEDDMAPDPDLWPDVLALIAAEARPDRYIRLPAKPREIPAATLARAGAARLVLPRVIGLQTVCQVVGRRAALRLLDASTAIDRPVDSFLQMHWITGQPVHTILPAPVRELTADLGGSTIQKPASGNRALREVRRFAYRSRIARHPQG